MQIVIDIPDKDVPSRQNLVSINLHFVAGEVCGCSYPYKVLPKRHGRLIDYSWVVKNVIKKLGIKDERYLLEAEKALMSIVYTAPTIIEADKAESEE